MHLRPLVAALAALSLGTASLAFADDHDRDHDREHAQDRDHHDERARNDRHDRHDDRGPDRHDARHEGRGAGPDHAFYRGGRLPAEYRNRQYVVDDWRGHRLSAPPRGYHWVQTGGDYVLAAIATGVIASVLLGQ